MHPRCRNHQSPPSGFGDQQPPVPPTQPRGFRRRQPPDVLPQLARRRPDRIADIGLRWSIQTEIGKPRFSLRRKLFLAGRRFQLSKIGTTSWNREFWTQTNFAASWIGENV